MDMAATVGCSSQGEDNYMQHEITDHLRISFTQRLKAYMISEKGRNLTLGGSVGYALFPIVFYFALLLSKIFISTQIEDRVLQSFMGAMYSVSILCVSLLLVLGQYGHLSTCDSYKHQHSTAFIRAGMIGLGTGGLVYRAIMIICNIADDSECMNVPYLITSLLGSIFTLLQMAFLIQYSLVEINKTVFLSIVSRFMAMQVVATNICLWLQIIVEETIHEISHSNYEIHEANTTHNSTTSITGGTIVCSLQSNVRSLLSPYLFALMVEFSIVASTMVIAIWEKTGLNMHKPRQLQILDFEGEEQSLDPVTPELNSIASQNDHDAVVNNSIIERSHSTMKGSHPTHKSYRGFLAGWLVICVVFTVTVFSLYMIHTESSSLSEYTVEIVYGTSLLVAVLCILIIPLTMYSMTQLTFKDSEIRSIQRPGYSVLSSMTHSNVHRQLEHHLLNITYVALLAYRALCILAAVNQNESESQTSHEIVMLIDSIVVIVMAGLQTMFCNWFASQKRSTTEENLLYKPGKQGLEFLRCCNFALWFLNSFLLKKSEAKADQVEVFGETTWLILSNIFHPLAILYYFHSFICMAEIIHKCYTHKYIGVVRSSKKNGKLLRTLSNSSSSNPTES